MLLDLLFKFDLQWCITVAIALVTFLFVSQWQQRRSLPPGPFPLPILGNILSFRRKDVRFDEWINLWRKTYGDIFTVWLGPKPSIMVCGWDLIHEALIVQRNAFAGRVSRLSGDIFLNGHQDVILTDFNPTWEVLRKLLLSAVRKYSNSEKLPILVDDVVEQTLKSMLKENGPVDIDLYIYLAVYNILASTAFGQRYAVNDKEFLDLKKTNDTLNEEFTAGLPADFIPWLRYPTYHKEKRFTFLARKFGDVLCEKYRSHKKTYVSGVIRDFTDAMLAAKEEAEKEDSSAAQHLTDGNLEMLTFDLFSAGTDTTRITMNWILIYLSKYQEVQEKVRQEVFENIGDRMPVQEDKYQCPYTIAVMTEILRVRPIVSFTLEHKATCDAHLAGYDIPKDTSITFHIQSQHNDKEFWPEPEVFKPERHLDANGKLSNERMKGYFPFGLGRRGCPGEKLAKADLFLLVTRMLQKVRFLPPGDGPDSVDLEPKNVIFVNIPKEFKLRVERIQAMAN